MQIQFDPNCVKSYRELGAASVYKWNKLNEAINSQSMDKTEGGEKLATREKIIGV